MEGMRPTRSGAQPAAAQGRQSGAAATPPQAEQARPRGRLRSALFSGPAPTGAVLLPGAESAAPARPGLAGQGRASRRAEIDPVVAALSRPVTVRRTGTPLTTFHRALAAPIAWVFGLLGFAPGQLSMQSLTVTVLAMATAADGGATHLITGGALVYLGLLLDRADAILAERKGAPGPWTMFLGVAIDRLVELSLIAGLGVIAVQDARHPLGNWLVLPAGWLPIIIVGAGGLWLTRRALEQTAETILLRTHLISTRRLPGPMALARHGPVRPLIGSLIGRDETIVLCAVGIALGQISATAVALLAIQAIGVVEAIIVFHMRLREPEIEASRVLGPDYP